MPKLPPPRPWLFALLLSLGCSTGLSPYADYPGPDGDDGERTANGAPSAAAMAAADPVNPAAAPPTPPAAIAAPPSVTTPPSAPRPRDDMPSSDADQPMPSCAIHALTTTDCPPPDALLRAAQGLPCRRDQLDQRCAYPSADDSANLLECVPSEEGPDPHWVFRQARCRRSCSSDLPHPFTPFTTSNCAARSLYPCDGAATDQDAVDDALKNIARQCAAPPSMVLGLLLGDDGCGRALFIEDAGAIAKCASDELMRWRFGCAPRCASTKEAGDTLIE